MFTLTTSERIKQARINKGLTQEELGKLIGVQRAAINKYESGLVVNLKRTTIAALAKALDVKPSWLLCVDDDPESAISPAKQELLDLVDDLTDEQAKKVMEIIQIALKL